MTLIVAWRWSSRESRNWSASCLRHCHRLRPAGNGRCILGQLFRKVGDRDAERNDGAKVSPPRAPRGSVTAQHHVGRIGDHLKASTHRILQGGAGLDSRCGRRVPLAAWVCCVFVTPLSRSVVAMSSRSGLCDGDLHPPRRDPKSMSSLTPPTPVILINGLRDGERRHAGTGDEPGATKTTTTFGGRCWPGPGSAPPLPTGRSPGAWSSPKIARSEWGSLSSYHRSCCGLRQARGQLASPAAGRCSCASSRADCRDDHGSRLSTTARRRRPATPFPRGGHDGHPPSSRSPTRT